MLASHRGYENYCLADPAFYEAPERVRGDDVDFELAGRPVPEGWKRAEIDDWLAYAPTGLDLPGQGWKVHVSACLDNAETILATVWDYCVPRRIAFKFIRSRQLLLMRNAKYADRAASGKFVTIYPADEEQLFETLDGLDALLAGQPGPYILSDLRWKAGPLYVRYGGFAERFCPGPDGDLELAIENAQGELVPDRRGPTFAVPSWVRLPAFLEPQLAARQQATLADIPYRFDKALHFSNGGGVYAAMDQRSGVQVVLKEARPHAGLDLSGCDAVTRLEHERDVLHRLADVDAVPDVLGTFVLGDHHFLALELVEGTPLRSLMAQKLPIALETPTEAAVADYAAWALSTLRRVEETVAEVHSRGIVIGDLHPFNVLVRPDGRITLIDLEVATPVEQARRQTLADPHFMAPAGVHGFDVDRYALACLRLFLFLPLTALIALSPEKARELADVVAETYPVPRDFVDDAVRTIERAWRGSSGRPAATGCPTSLVPDVAGWERARGSMAAAILASATPGREDRLFPGDVSQFATGGANLAHGAAGVLYALAETGAGRHPELEDWLVRRALAPEPGARLGFYDGLHGVAYVLERLGRGEEALDLLDICRREIKDGWDRLGLDLASGLAGIGLNLAHFAELTGDASLWDEALHAAQVTAERLGGVHDVAEVSGGDHPYAGLLRGSSGPALLFLRLHERTGDHAWLDLAATALAQDLRRCHVRDEDGSLEVNEGWRTMPYLAEGSVGIGLVLDAFLRVRPHDRFSAALERIDRAARGQFYVEPGLFHGRAGMVAYLALRERDDPRGEAVARHVRRLAWHALGYRGHLAFPGQELLRLSMDLGTGTAGVLLAMGLALAEGPVALPLLPPTSDRRAGRRAQPGPERQEGGERHGTSRLAGHDPGGTPPGQAFR